MDISRRHWVVGSFCGVAWTEIAAAAQHAHEAQQADPPQKLTVLDAATARDVEALAALILPSDDGPGAREAGVIWFIDRALATFDENQRGLYRTGMAEVGRIRARMFPDSTNVAGLAGDQQKALIRAIESSEFFGLLRRHTVMGFLGHPKYGGNRDQVGWKHIGFESRTAFAHPFGYYDAPGMDR